MTEQRWPGLSYLDVLRPDPGWHVEAAILATYSADLVAIVAAMLALAGLDSDQGSGSKVDFANAFEVLRGRMKVLVQAGRIALPTHRKPVLSILDQFIEEVHQDEAKGSWHPKIALIKLRFEEGEQISWRLWIGSRNLTRSFDWDAGLCLISESTKNSHTIDGIADLGATLAELAKLVDFSPKDVHRELSRLSWRLPDGVKSIPELRLMLPSMARGLPAPPEQLRRLFVISPFLDVKTIRRLSEWGDEHTERHLLSLRHQLENLFARDVSCMSGFQQLFHLGIPDPDGLNAQNSEEIVESEDEEEDFRGLHSKLIYAKHASGSTLWLGSSNATKRGWEGPNTEVFARLEIEPILAEGLEVFVCQLAQPIKVDSLEAVAEEDSVAEALNKARQQIAVNWQVQQRRSTDGNWLVAEVPPHPEVQEIKLWVGALTGNLVIWSRGLSEVQLPRAAYGLDTELVQIKIVLDDESVTWLQRAPLNPPPDEERDRQVLTHYLDPKTFLEWIKSLLFGEDIGDGGGDWQEIRPSKSGKYEGPDWWAPTLEEVLRAWSRDPSNLVDVDQKVKAYMESMKKFNAQHGEPEIGEVLTEFQQTWQTVRNVLLEKRP